MQSHELTKVYSIGLANDLYRNYLTYLLEEGCLTQFQPMVNNLWYFLPARGKKDSNTLWLALYTFVWRPQSALTES